MDDEFGDSREDIPPEEAAKHRKKLEAEQQFEEGKNEYLKDILGKEIIRGKPRRRLVIEGYNFVIFFIIFLCFVALTKVDPDGLELIEGFQRTLVHQPIPAVSEQYQQHATTMKDVYTMDQAIDWVAYVLYPAICETGTYGYINEYNFVLYGLRLRQQRVKSAVAQRSIGSLTQYTVVNETVYSDLSTDTEYTGTWFGEEWQSAAALENDIFYGQDAMLQGRFTESWYHGSGFIKDFQLNGSTTSIQDSILSLNSTTGWLDGNTRALIVQFTTFNPSNFKMMCVTVLFELTTSGTVIATPEFHTMRMLGYSVETPGSILQIVFIVLITLYTIWFTLIELYQMFLNPNLLNDLKHEEEDDTAMDDNTGTIPIYQRPFVYLTKFFDFWEIIHVLNIIMFIVALYIRVRWYQFKEVSDFTLNDANTSFKNMLPFSLFKTSENSLTFFNVLLCFVKLFKFMRLSMRLNVLWLTLVRAANLLLGFCTMVLLIFGGFSTMGMVVFGTLRREYYSFWGSASTLFQMLLGDFDYNSLRAINREVAGTFFYLYMIIVFLTLLNMFISILNESYNDVSLTLRELKAPDPVITWLEIFFGERIAAWLKVHCDKFVDKFKDEDMDTVSHSELAALGSHDSGNVESDGLEALAEGLAGSLANAADDADAIGDQAIDAAAEAAGAMGGQMDDASASAANSTVQALEDSAQAIEDTMLNS